MKAEKKEVLEEQMQDRKKPTKIKNVEKKHIKGRIRILDISQLVIRLQIQIEGNGVKENAGGGVLRKNEMTEENHQTC